MHVVEKFGYAADETMQVVRLPFAGGDVAWDVVVPKAGAAVADAERALLRGGYVMALVAESVRVALPKFTVGAPQQGGASPRPWVELGDCGRWRSRWPPWSPRSPRSPRLAPSAPSSPASSGGATRSRMPAALAHLGR